MMNRRKLEETLVKGLMVASLALILGILAAIVVSALGSSTANSATQACRTEAKQFLNSIGGDPWITTPDEGQARLLQDIRDWGEYVRTAQIEPQG